jgi:hypothetical protein
MMKYDENWKIAKTVRCPVSRIRSDCHVTFAMPKIGSSVKKCQDQYADSAALLVPAV